MAFGGFVDAGFLLWLLAREEQVRLERHPGGASDFRVIVRVVVLIALVDIASICYRIAGSEINKLGLFLMKYIFYTL